jgi:hypothetical protein
VSRLLIAAIVAMLAGCAPLIPIVTATSYVTGQVIAAYMPDSIERGSK